MIKANKLLISINFLFFLFKSYLIILLNNTTKSNNAPYFSKPCEIYSLSRSKLLLLILLDNLKSEYSFIHVSVGSECNVPTISPNLLQLFLSFQKSYDGLPPPKNSTIVTASSMLLYYNFGQMFNFKSVNVFADLDIIGSNPSFKTTNDK